MKTITIEDVEKKDINQVTILDIRPEDAPGNEENIDISFYRNLVDKMLEEIGKYGDPEWFTSDDPYVPAEKPKDTMDFMNIPIDANEEVPFDEDSEELPFC